MIRLNSNAIKTQGQQWYGRDAAQIVYPSVSSCITVTCVVGEMLAGLHLASMAGSEITNKDISTFGTIAEGAGAMYVAGMLSRRWTTSGVKNQTGLIYQGIDGGTLIARLREATGYAGVVNVCDTSEVGEEITITASRTGTAATFTTSRDDGGGLAPLVGFEAMAGNVILVSASKKKSGGCIIL